jgi:hypothetical protein
MRPSGWFSFVLVVTSVFPAMAKEPDAVLMLDAKKETVACLVDASVKTLPDCTCPKLRKLFLVQGQRAELRVYNRKFLSDYSITVDAVTTLTGPQIRNLPEAENLIRETHFTISLAPKSLAHRKGQRRSGCSNPPVSWALFPQPRATIGSWACSLNRS